MRPYDTSTHLNAKQSPEEIRRILFSVVDHPLGGELYGSELSGAVHDSVNRAEANLMQVGGQVTSSITPNAYQGYGGYSTSSENRPCAVCRARGVRRTWVYDEAKRKLVKDKMEACGACQGKGWSAVFTTHYPGYQYTVTNDIIPTPMPTIPPTPVYPVTYPTPNTGPFFGNVCKSEVN